jgi:hypothetical protein
MDTPFHLGFPKIRYPLPPSKVANPPYPPIANYTREEGRPKAFVLTGSAKNEAKISRTRVDVRAKLRVVRNALFWQEKNDLFRVQTRLLTT